MCNMLQKARMKLGWDAPLLGVAGPASGDGEPALMWAVEALMWAVFRWYNNWANTVSCLL